MKIRILILAFFLTITVLNGQDRFDILDEKLNQIGKNYPGINDKVELSLKDATIQDFVRAIGTSNNLNVTVDPTLDIKITNSFKNVTAKEVFIFLCKRYDLDITFVGPIITLGKYTAPVAPVKVTTGKKVNVKYEKTADLFS